MSKKTTASQEDYLEAIYNLEQLGAPIKSVDIARLLDVSRASVNKALGTLVDAGYAVHEHYGDLFLTAAGRKAARIVQERHTMLKTFLIKILGVDNQTAEQDACRMEHTISPETAKRFAAYLQKVL